MKQLYLPFEGVVGHCPVCIPSGDPRIDLFRSMCERHHLEYKESLEDFHLEMKIPQHSHAMPIPLRGIVFG
jgi:hypothetical protein